MKTKAKQVTLLVVFEFSASDKYTFPQSNFSPEFYFNLFTPLFTFALHPNQVTWYIKLIITSLE